MRLGIDTGGTFTDFVLLEGGGAEPLRLRTHKVLSTPDAPERAILQGIRELGLAEAMARGQLQLVHGSTVATNAALEGKGVRTAFVTNRGFADLLSIGRQTRPHLYRLQQTQLAPPVPQELCLETGGRCSARGELVEPLTEADLQELVEQIRSLQPRAVAITLLFSYLDDRAEQHIANTLRTALPWLEAVCHSAAVLPEYREYERGIATWLNASLGPHMARYLRELRRQTHPAPLAVMQSSGGTIAAELAAEQSVRLLLSGPAGGIAAVEWLAGTSGQQRFLTFDMGGTSTDVALFDGKPGLTSEGHLGRWPVAVPMIDMHTIGAGGGSLAWLDAGGLLQVGPQSAGADPGPACYGRGGRQATVTDANLVLGRLLPDVPLGGSFVPSLPAATQAIQTLAEKSGLAYMELAEGIVRVANEHMAQALRQISLARGHDPRQFQLCCFGGAGGLHVCALARELGMDRAVVPAHAGVFSALGMLLAPASRQLSRTWLQPLDRLDSAALQQQIALLREAACSQLVAEGHDPARIQTEVSTDLRYRGQSATLNVPWQNAAQAADDFATLHQARYQFSLPEPVELVTLRVAATHVADLPPLPGLAAGPLAEPLRHTRLHGFADPVPVYQRSKLPAAQALQGPALILDAGTTLLLEPGWQAKVDEPGSLWLRFSHR